MRLSKALFLMVIATGAAVVISLIAVTFLKRPLPSLPARQNNPVVPSGSAQASSASGPTPAAIKQGLEDEIAKIKQRLHFSPPNGDAIVQALTPADLQALSVIAASKTTNLDPKLLHTLSPTAMAAIPLLLAYESDTARALGDKTAWASKATAVIREGASLADNHGYKTEDNWLATSISRELADMAFLIVHANQSLPSFQVTATVDPLQPRVHAEIVGWPGEEGDRVSADLTPTFAWDDKGYAQLARQLLGKTVHLPSPAASETPDIVTRLLDLTGAEIADEDVSVSQRLEQSPASVSDHEAAALVLVALALRENAGEYTDNRLLLNRATAHLALAQALRGDQAESWAGLLAEAGLLTVSGREPDSVATLDALKARPDCPDSAKIWLTGLHVLAKEDWRIATVDVTSPLLLKILWFQVLSHDLTDLAATRRLDQILSSDPASSETSVPDWGRAIVAPTYELSVENGQRFGQANMTLEFQELDAELKIEGAPPLDHENLAPTFSRPQEPTVSTDAQGKPSIHVVGSGAFASATRHHLFTDIRPGIYSLKNALGLRAEGETFHSRMKILFHGVPQFEFVECETAEDSDSDPDSQTYSIEEAPVGFIEIRKNDDLMHRFFNRSVPFGTAFQAETRDYLRRNNREREFYRNGGTNPDEKYSEIAQLPRGEQPAAEKKFNEDQRLEPQKYTPPPLSSEEKAMLKLAPDNFSLVTQSQTTFVNAPQASGNQEKLKHLQITPEVDAILDHNLRYIKSLRGFNLIEADEEMLLHKQVRLDPDTQFQLAAILRASGHEDEAAEMDRKAVAQAYDQVLMSNCVWQLLCYDLDHGLNEEALAIGKRAADVYSEAGLMADLMVLERLGHLDEAEQNGQDIDDRYQNDRPLDFFYARNPSRYPIQNKKVMTKYFPNGMVNVQLSSFSGRPHGAVFRGLDLTAAHLGFHEGDVIVALDGKKVESADQYVLLCGLSLDKHLDIILWKDQKKYVEVKAVIPGRFFNVGLYDF